VKGNGATTRKKAEPKLSKDGKWRAFPKQPNLLQYVASKVYFGRIKTGGKIIRRSLETDVYTTALLRLGDFLRENRIEPVPHNSPETFAEARGVFCRQMEARHDIKLRTKEYWKYCVELLNRTWPELEFQKLRSITAHECQAWASKFSKNFDDRLFNNTLSVLRRIIDLGHVGSNPAKSVRRLGVKPKQLQLPEPSEFERLLDNLENAGGRFSRAAADHVRFLAFSGCRLSEASQVTWKDVSLKKGTICVQNAKRHLTSNARQTRLVPIIPDMHELLGRWLSDNPKPSDRVCKVTNCHLALKRACREIGIAHLCHHDLRHLFATRCIESGVDVPTVARWLGHTDGGALAMRTYGHLRTHHSQEMAKKVTFKTTTAKPGTASEQA